MPARLKGHQAPTREARSILVKQVHKALEPLTGTATDEVIHHSRKRIKMARATLRLLRTSLTNEQYSRANCRLRDAARPLSRLRDSLVLLRTLDTLVPKRRAASGVNNLRRGLEAERSRLLRATAGRQSLNQTVDLLRQTGARAHGWHIPARGWSSIGPQIKKTYRKGRKGLKLACRTMTDTALHEWRKQTQYLRHQLALLEILDTSAIRAAVRDTHRLSDLLGDDHDLAVLRGKIGARPDAHSIAAEIDSRRAVLQREAIKLGSNVYKAAPRHFCRRLHSRWQHWSKHTGG